MALTQYSDAFTLLSLTGSTDDSDGAAKDITLSSDCISDINNNDSVVIALLDYTFEALNANPVTNAPGYAGNGNKMAYQFNVAFGGDGGSEFGSDGSSNFQPTIIGTVGGTPDILSSSQSAYLSIMNASTPGTPVWADIRRKTSAGVYAADGNSITTINTSFATARSGNVDSSMPFINQASVSKDGTGHFHQLTRMFFAFDTSGVSNLDSASLRLRVKAVATQPTLGVFHAVTSIASSSHSLILAKVDPAGALVSSNAHSGFFGSGVALGLGPIYGSIPGTGSADTSWIAVASTTPSATVDPTSGSLVGGDFTLNTFSSIILGAQYTQTGDQVPFSLGTPGVRYLRGRTTAYATEKGETVAAEGDKRERDKKKKENRG